MIWKKKNATLMPYTISYSCRFQIRIHSHFVDWIRLNAFGFIYSLNLCVESWIKWDFVYFQLFNWITDNLNDHLLALHWSIRRVHQIANWLWLIVKLQCMLNIHDITYLCYYQWTNLFIVIENSMNFSFKIANFAIIAYI